jgi:hypothetical protein
MQTLTYILICAFIAGLGFAPAKDLPERVKKAGQFAAIAGALAVVARLLFVRVLSE